MRHGAPRSCAPAPEKNRDSPLIFRATASATLLLLLLLPPPTLDRSKAWFTGLNQGDRPAPDHPRTFYRLCREFSDFWPQPGKRQKFPGFNVI
jgi:hypothetical protein